MTQTVLDAAHAAMMGSPDNDTVRLRFYERLGDVELFLLLEGEAEDEKITPQIYDPGTGPIVLVFDRQERLTAFVGAAAPYAALGLHLDVAPSAFLLDAQGVSWLAETLGHEPDEIEVQIAELSAPAGLPDLLLTAIDTKLATATGLAQMAYLVGTVDAAGTRSHMLAFIGAAPGAETALARAASEALTFSGIEAGAMDVSFFDADAPIAERLSRVGLRFDLPQPALVNPPEMIAPGSDPTKPPRLR